MPSAFTPVASRACTLTVLLPSRTFNTRASAARKVYGPASNGRLRNASTWPSRSLAISRPGILTAGLSPAARPASPSAASRRQAGNWSPPPTPAPTRPAGAAPAASPESSCPAAASGSPHRLPGPGVPTSLPITIAGVAPVQAGLAVTGAAHRIGVGRHQRLGECLQHLRRRSGLAWDTCSIIQPGRSILCCAVIVVLLV